MSVRYISVTQPAVQEFAEYPVLEASFPKDFFYPFVSSKVGIIIIQCTYYYYYCIHILDFSWSVFCEI